MTNLSYGCIVKTAIYTKLFKTISFNKLLSLLEQVDL